jgi:hypothetical protein
MKNLIQESIKFIGIPESETLTIFNIKNDYEKKGFYYKELTFISGRKLMVKFDVEEDGRKSNVMMPISIVRSSNEEEIKQNILDSINDKINN